MDDEEQDQELQGDDGCYQTFAWKQVVAAKSCCTRLEARMGLSIRRVLGGWAHSYERGTPVD